MTSKVFDYIAMEQRRQETTVELIANGTASLHRYVQLMRTDATLKDASDAAPWAAA